MKTVCVAILLCLLAYLPSMWEAQPVYEDAEALLSAQTSAPFSQRFLTNATLRLTPTPLSARVVNLVLHLTVVLLAGVLMVRLGYAPIAPAAVLLMLHPVATETLMYLSGRGELIVAIGVLIACIASAGSWWRWYAMVGILMGMLIAVGGKQSGIVVCLLVPFTIWYCHAEHRPWWVYPSATALILCGLL